MAYQIGLRARQSLAFNGPSSTPLHASNVITHVSEVGVVSRTLVTSPVSLDLNSLTDGGRGLLAV